MERDPELKPPEDIPAVSAEALVSGGVHPDGVGERRYPSTIGGGIFLVVLAVVIGALVVVLVGPWRTGIQIIGGALRAAALARLLLSPRDAGMLAVRFKALDVAVLVALGAALIALAVSIPDQPGA